MHLAEAQLGMRLLRFGIHERNSPQPTFRSRHVSTTQFHISGKIDVANEPELAA